MGGFARLIEARQSGPDQSAQRLPAWASADPTDADQPYVSQAAPSVRRIVLQRDQVRLSVETPFGLERASINEAARKNAKTR
jgi:hypothetical protein